MAGKVPRRLSWLLALSVVGSVGAPLVAHSAQPVAAAVQPAADGQAGAQFEWLGMTVTPLTARLAAGLGMTPGGALVLEVAADGPAAQAGLASGDVVRGVNGVELSAVDPSRRFRAVAEGVSAGDWMLLSVERGGQPLETTVQAGGPPQRREPGRPPQGRGNDRPGQGDGHGEGDGNDRRPGPDRRPDNDDDRRPRDRDGERPDRDGRPQPTGTATPVAGTPTPASTPVPGQVQAVTALRSIDGTGNNPQKPQQGAVGTLFTRIAPARFSDGMRALPEGDPNPRTISNQVVAGQGDTPDPGGLSGMMYAWGQFIDHDLDLMQSDGATHIDITIPAGDPVLRASTIPLTRTIIDPATGRDGKPGAAVNHITGWLDASMVYGSDATTAAALRAPDGRMLTSDGDNLPVVQGAFAAGDVRAGENPDLTALQLLFVREHNTQVAKLRAQHADWSAEQLYQQARAIVTAEIEHITYDEFLPHLLGQGALRPYRGYDPQVDASISTEFAGAAFRFGHSIVSANLQKVGEQGQDAGAPTSLRDAFFQAPAAFEADGGGAGHLRHLAGDVSNALDAHLVDDLRNFLDVPGAAMDLAAINIQRGRDLGLNTLNETRRALGLRPYTDFSQITSDGATVAAMRTTYGSVDRVDLWLGGLAENHRPGAMVGQTFWEILRRQFEALRDGDRFWYQNQGFDQGTLQAIQRSSLAEVILRNTDTKHIQPDVFVFYARRSGAAAGITAEEADAPQLVIGSDGADTLAGGEEEDVLVAGSGAQTLTGRGGRDVFVLGKAGTSATVTDFHPEDDTLLFEGVSSTADLRITASGSGTRIEWATGSVTLQGVAPNRLRPANLRFRS